MGMFFFFFLVLAVFGEFVFFALRTAWGLIGVFTWFMLFPLALAAFIIGGFLHIAFFALLAVGAAMLLIGKMS